MLSNPQMASRARHALAVRPTRPLDTLPHLHPLSIRTLRASSDWRAPVQATPLAGSRSEAGFRAEGPTHPAEDPSAQSAMFVPVCPVRRRARPREMAYQGPVSLSRHAASSTISPVPSPWFPIGPINSYGPRASSIARRAIFLISSCRSIVCAFGSRSFINSVRPL